MDLLFPYIYINTKKVQTSHGRRHNKIVFADSAQIADLQ